MRPQNSGRVLQSTSTTFDIIDALIELGGGRVTEVADVLDVSKSTVYNHLHTLRNEGYVVMRGDEYHLGLKFLCVGEQAKMSDHSYQDAIDVTTRLDEKTPFETGFIVEENGVGRFLKPEVSQSSTYDQFSLTGEKVHLHAVAAGKAILATFSEERIDAIIDEWNLPKVTEQTIGTREELFEEIDTVRKRGYAINQSENREGIYGVAKAARKPDGTTLGGMSMTGPVYRTKEGEFDEHAASLLDEHISKLEERIRP
jgi:IclR family acetate operon transcriptional repressor